MVKSRILYGISLLACLLLAFGYGDGQVGFAILYSLILLLGFSLLTVLLAPRLIRVEQKAAEEIIFKNETLPYSVTIRNTGLFLYPRVRCTLSQADITRYGGEGQITFPLLPRAGLRRDYTVEFPFRGDYAVGVESLVVTDFLGLLKRTITPEGGVRVVVYPQGDDGFALRMRNEPQNASLSTDLFNEDYSSVADVRKYTNSDSLRKIHWKLSAKRGELMVKNFNAFEPDKTILLLDTRPLPLEGSPRAYFEDRMVSYVASAVDYCMQGNLPAQLLYGQTEAQSAQLGHGDDVGEVYRLLACIRFGEEQSALGVAREMAGAYNLVVFTAGLDGPMFEALKEMISFDHNIMLFFFSSPELPATQEQESYLESLRAWGAAVNQVDLEAYTPLAEGPQAS